MIFAVYMAHNLLIRISTIFIWYNCLNSKITNFARFF